jgi:hypothetical protein
MYTRSAVPLPELAAAAPLDHIEAVTIVREVARRVARGEFPGVPSAHVIRLSASGALSTEGPIAADAFAVRRAGQLLEALLPAFDAQVRVPGALRLIVARALGTMDLPPYPSLDSFADALSRFAARDAVECFCQVVANRPETADAEAPVEGVAAVADSMITVSDIRRARRATGVSLAEISRRSSVPRHLLRELEWGYFDNWPASHVGRRLIISYARAAGLDEQLVTRTVWPLLAESVRSRGALRLEKLPSLPIVVDVAPSEPERPAAVMSTSLARIEPAVQRRWGARRVVAVLAIPALLAIGAAPAMWEHSAARREAPQRTTSAPSAPVARPPVRAAEVQPAAPESAVSAPEVMIAPQTAQGTPVRTSGVIVRQAAYRVPHAAPVKVKRRPVVKSSNTSQLRRGSTGSKGPRKWGVWVLNKVGVRIVSTDEQQ